MADVIPVYIVALGRFLHTVIRCPPNVPAFSCERQRAAEGRPTSSSAATPCWAAWSRRSKWVLPDPPESLGEHKFRKILRVGKIPTKCFGVAFRIDRYDDPRACALLVRD